MSIICPHCNSSFEPMMLEEMVNPTLTISRRVKERSSWTEIAEIISRGEVRRLFDVGDSISCTLKNGKDVNLIVTAIDPYQPNQVAFEFDNLLPDTKYMNRTNTNRGGWKDSYMRQYMKEVFDLLPDDLKSVIVPRKIVQKLSDGSQNMSEDNFLWLRSLTESGHRAYEADVGDVAFPYFTGQRSRIKELEGETYYYWLRSPYIYGSSNFWNVYSSGTCYSYGATNTNGVCPCFFIGGTPNA